MTPELARIALKFLERTTFQGNELEALVAVRNALYDAAFPASPEEQVEGTDDAATSAPPAGSPAGKANGRRGAGQPVA